MRTWHLAEQTREIDFDVVFFLATMALLVLGTVMIFSSSYFVSKELYGNGITMTKKHLFHVVLGTVSMLGIMAVDYRRLCNRRLVLFALAGSALALVLCFVPVIGHSGGHSRRWVGIGPAVVQASELAKLALLLFVASYLSRKARHMDDFARGPLPVLAIVAPMCLLIFIEPDFGTAAALGIWSVMMLFMAGMRIKHLLALIGGVLPLGIAAMVLEPYRFARLKAFVNPWDDMLGIGYQIIQAMVGFANGRLFGSGLGEGTQKLFFLPAPHTDFILAVVGEELGFIGVLLVAALFGVWIWRGFSIALATNDSFGYHLVIASVCLVGLQAVLNMGVALSVLPTTGIALPFFSYGGSALLSTMCICGVILSVSRRARL
ncbi:MAG TPA: putative lipid II flippase FtsW [Deltaproteobacteria bacterium]|nr:putative lipid II flippase FtsW [Deltaproteobacteria bacterium]